MTEQHPQPDDLKTRLARTAREIFYVDLRSLAALRIGLGLVILADLATRARHLVAHYTDMGVAPSDVVLADYGWGCYLSVHWWASGSVTAVAAVFAGSGVVAMLLVAGWRTRIMTIACWYLASSLHVRMQMLNNAGDGTLELLLFWSIFLPLGARWAIDARRTEPAADRHVSIATFGLLTQIAYIYFFAAVLKLFVDVWQDGDAVGFVLHLDSYTTPVSAWLAQFEGVFKFLTMATLFWELFGPLLIFAPVITPWARTIGILGFWSMHLGFGLALSLGIFPWISAVAWIAFIPTELWDRVLPSSVARPGVPPLRLRRVAAYVAAGACVLVFVANLRSVKPIKRLVPRFVSQASKAVRLQQGWSMFTDLRYDGVYSGWYIVAATLDDRTEVDLLLDGAPLTWEPPRYGTERYATARWAQFHYYVHDPQESPFWAPYADYLCRTWADRTDMGRIETIAIWYMMRVRDSMGDERIIKVPLHEQSCP
jgi:hypothetical protein